MPDSMRLAGSSPFLIRTMACALILVLATGSMAFAQAIHDPVDLHIKVINGTSGGPGTLDRLQIQYRSSILQPVLDTVPGGSEFTLEGVPIKNIGQYIVTAWKNGVPYFKTFRGSVMIEQEITLHIFDTTDSCEGISISGLTMLVKKSGSLLNLEYMFNISNTATPQITVLGEPTFELEMPAGYSQLKVEYNRGPDPIAIPVTKISNSTIGLTVPLTSGGTAISLKAVIPFTEAMELPIAGNLPVESWSIMTYPNNLVADSFEVEAEPEADHGMEGWNRYLGPVLESDRNLAIRLISAPKAGARENLFSEQKKDQPEKQQEGPAGADNEDKDKFPWIPIGFVTILTIAMAVKRRRR